MPVGPRERPEGLWRGCHWGDMAGAPADGIGVKGYKNKEVISTLYVYPRGGAVSGHPDCRVKKSLAPSRFTQITLTGIQ